MRGKGVLSIGKTAGHKLCWQSGVVAVRDLNSMTRRTPSAPMRSLFRLPTGRPVAAVVLASLLPLVSPVTGMAQSADAPPVAATSPAPLASPGMVELSFDFSQGVIILDVDYGGTRPAKVALDTGDADSLLDLDAARAIGLPLDMKDLKGAGSGEGAVTFYKTDPPRAKLGAAEFPGKGLIVMPVAKNLLEDSGIRCEGTLGYEFFKDRVVQIDYPERKLRLYAAAPKGDIRGATEGADLPIQWRQYHSQSPQLITTDQLRIGEHAIPAQIDTCFAHSLILFTTKLPWLETRPTSEVEAVHYEEATLQPATVLAPVALGNLHFKTNPLAYLARADAHVPETDIAAVIGNRFFEAGVLTLDFRTGRLSAEWKAARAE